MLFEIHFKLIIFEIKQNELNYITKTILKRKQREEKEGQWEYDDKSQNNERTKEKPHNNQPILQVKKE